jgi:hypothetical protein
MFQENNLNLVCHFEVLLEAKGKFEADNIQFNNVAAMQQKVLRQRSKERKSKVLPEN